MTCFSEWPCKVGARGPYSVEEEGARSFVRIRRRLSSLYTMGDQEYGVSNGDEQYQQQETYQEQPLQQTESGSGDGPLNPGDKINASKNDDDER